MTDKEGRPPAGDTGGSPQAPGGAGTQPAGASPPAAGWPGAARNPQGPAGAPLPGAPGTAGVAGSPPAGIPQPAQGPVGAPLSGAPETAGASGSPPDGIPQPAQSPVGAPLPGAQPGGAAQNPQGPAGTAWNNWAAQAGQNSQNQGPAQAPGRNYPPGGWQPQNGYVPPPGACGSGQPQAGGYVPGAWQVPPQVLYAARGQGAPAKKPGLWKRGMQAIRKLWKRLVSSLVVRIVCNGAVSALAGFVASVIISAVLNLSGFTTFLFFAAITLLVFIKMTNHTMAYVKDIAEAVGKISGGDYSVKVPEKYSDELGTLASQINQMTTELSRAREREQLEEQRKNEFITSIAHDLRTPLTSVIGYLGLISEQDGQPVDKETLVQYADVAYRKSKRLELLINQLFDFSRYNFGEIKPAENRIDLAELLEQINQEFYPQFAENRLESRVIVSGRPVWVKGDGNMLVRVFDNILGNAVRYGSAGRYIDIELYNRGTEAVVRVTNYGAEISPADLTRIFDKFYRTDASRSSGTGGAGLGMAIAKNIVEAHGGSIRAFSGDGKVTFEVVLPVLAQ